MKARMIVTTVLMSLLLSTAAFAQGLGEGGGYRFNQKNTPGWALMSPEERAEHRKEMLSAKNYDECKAIQARHHEKMTLRAKNKNLTLNTPKVNACERMKARGMLK